MCLFPPTGQTGLWLLWWSTSWAKRSSRSASLERNIFVSSCYSADFGDKIHVFITADTFWVKRKAWKWVNSLTSAVGESMTLLNLTIVLLSFLWRRKKFISQRHYACNVWMATCQQGHTAPACVQRARRWDFVCSFVCVPPQTHKLHLNCSIINREHHVWKPAAVTMLRFLFARDKLDHFPPSILPVLRAAEARVPKSRSRVFVKTFLCWASDSRFLKHTFEFCEPRGLLS